MLKTAYDQGAQLALHSFMKQAWLPDLGTAASSAWDSISDSASSAGNWLSGAAGEAGNWLNNARYAIPEHARLLGRSFAESARDLYRDARYGIEDTSDALYRGMRGAGGRTGLNSLAARHFGGGVSQDVNSNTRINEEKKYLSDLMNRDQGVSVSPDMPSDFKPIPHLQEAQRDLYTENYRTNPVINQYRSQMGRALLPEAMKPVMGPGPSKAVFNIDPKLPYKYNFPNGNIFGSAQ